MPVYHHPVTRLRITRAPASVVLCLSAALAAAQPPSLRRSRQVLLAAARTPGLAPSPAPFVLHSSLDDFCVTYEINVYCDAPAQMIPLYTRLHQNILDVFNEYGVQIMTPAYRGDPEQPKVVPKEQWWTAPARPDGPG